MKLVLMSQCTVCLCTLSTSDMSLIIKNELIIVWYACAGGMHVCRSNLLKASMAKHNKLFYLVVYIHT